MEQNVELGFIYYLQNPTTGEIFYVGATQTSLTNRLRTHYQHLREFERGLRGTNKRYLYLQNLRPEKATIHLLEVITNGNLEEKEIYYIKFFRKLNPNITNMTDGGKGKCISKYYTEKQMEELGNKLSLANKGYSKPIGFAENLSLQRKGLKNPATKELKDFIICFKDNKAIRIFKYGFEINDFIGKKDAYGNVYKVLTNQLKYNPYGYIWKYISQCNEKFKI